MTNLSFAWRDDARSFVWTAGATILREALDRGGYTLGGEQSGHIIFRDLATTGDGILSGLQVLDVMTRSGRALDELAAASMTQLPQVLINVKVAHPAPDIATRIASEIREAEKRLVRKVRLVRQASAQAPSGDGEAPDEAEAKLGADALVVAALARVVRTGSLASHGGSCGCCAAGPTQPPAPAVGLETLDRGIAFLAGPGTLRRGLACGAAWRKPRNPARLPG